MLKRGFTLIELLVAVGAMAIVILYTLGTFTANRNTYVVIDQVSQAHQTSLAIAGLMERDIRTAGYMVPAAAAACGFDSTNSPDVLYLSDSDAIRTADTLPSNLVGGDLAADITDGCCAAWNNPMTLTLDDVVIDGQPTYDTDATPGADSDFRLNGGAIITDLDNPARGVGCGIVTNVNAVGNQITIAPISGPTPGATGDWRVVPAHVYRINAGSFERDGVVMARDVEDLQIAWFYDDSAAGTQGQVDANEYKGDAGTNLLDTTNLPGADPGNLREIRFNLVVRTSEDDPNDPNSAGAGQARENQTAAPGADGRRRRVHTVTTRLRNLIP